jgi:hypothetical protein
MLSQRVINHSNGFFHQQSVQRRKRAFPAIQCTKSNGDDTAKASAKFDSRRQVLNQLCIGLAAFSTANSAAVSPVSALPGFKKDLTSKRKTIIPLEAFKEGPQGLKYFDVIVGEGPEAKQGERIAVHFDAKYKNITFITTRQGEGVTGGVPFGFDVGAKESAGGTLVGLDLGVRGMKVGGQRRLLVPANLAYGDKGVGDQIPPNAQLTIDVQLLSVKQNALGSRVKLVEG